ncbi:type VI secretion system protein TssA [Candidatus Halocynthiibacter alkanivorans]|uniref:type VI secretion system protein TssA n=1 Tax=Candidatus Halocynthiibacter alkanivorans TaxID=2267619 RepID=UPI000DF2F28F|nr:type VI secretion system protein TssA [Candidatus Halocynthiibacter alkanivorans]
MEILSLLKSHSDDAPSGENLEYDPVFTELEIVAQPGEERQAGEEILAAEDPDFREISAKAVEVLERSNDLRAAVYLAGATLRLEGLTGFAGVLEYIQGCLDQYWDSCHPQLDEDDGDPTMRVNAVQALADRDTILRALRLAPLTDSRTFGKLSLRDINIAEGEIAAPAKMDNVPDTASVSAAFQDTDDEYLSQGLAAAVAAQASAAAISAKFDEELPGQGPDLDELVKTLKQITGKLQQHSGLEVEVEEGTAEDGSPAGAAPAVAMAAASVPGAINSTNDVSNAIDRIVAYYEREEPASPVPVLLLRAKRLVGADFMAIIKDMAPEALDSVRRIGGIREEF